MCTFGNKRTDNANVHLHRTTRSKTPSQPFLASNQSLLHRSNGFYSRQTVPLSPSGDDTWQLSAFANSTASLPKIPAHRQQPSKPFGRRWASEMLPTCAHACSLASTPPGSIEPIAHSMYVAHASNALAAWRSRVQASWECSSLAAEVSQQHQQRQQQQRNVQQ